MHKAKASCEQDIPAIIPRTAPSHTVGGVTKAKMNGPRIAKEKKITPKLAISSSFLLRCPVFLDMPEFRISFEIFRNSRNLGIPSTRKKRHAILSADIVSSNAYSCSKKRANVISARINVNAYSNV